MYKLTKKFERNTVRKRLLCVDFERRSQNTCLKFKIWLARGMKSEFYFRGTVEDDGVERRRSDVKQP
jgi:hypothetical protein